MSNRQYSDEELCHISNQMYARLERGQIPAWEFSLIQMEIQTLRKLCFRDLSKYSHKYPQVKATKPRPAQELYFQTARERCLKQWPRKNPAERKAILQEAWKSHWESRHQEVPLRYVDEDGEFFRVWQKYEYLFVQPCSKEEFKDKRYHSDLI